MKKLISIMILLAVCIGKNLAQDTSRGIAFHDNESWESIMTLAKQENKKIFMDCYTTWCGPCKALAKDIFTQEKVGDYFNSRFINVKYDMEKGDGKMLYQKYKKHIIGFPTLLLISPQGEVLQQLAGYQEADALIEGIRKADEGKDLFTLAEEYRKGNRDLKFMKDYVSSLNAAFLKDTIDHIMKENISKLDPKELDKDDVWAVYGSYITDVNTPAFDYLVNNIYKFHLRMHRNRYDMEQQIEQSCNKVLRGIFKIQFDSLYAPLPLSTDTIAGQKMINYLLRAGLDAAEKAKAQLYVHKLLLRQQYPEAWQTILTFNKAGLSGFSAFNIHEYICYMASFVKDKKMLRSFLDELKGYEGNKKDFTFRMYHTMSEIGLKLGQKKEAALWMEKYQKEEETNRKQFEEYFKKK